MTWKLYELQILVSINKILLEHSHTNFFTLSMAALMRQLRLHSLKNLKYLLFTPLRKKFADPLSDVFDDTYLSKKYLWVILTWCVYSHIKIYVYMSLSICF